MNETSTDSTDSGSPSPVYDYQDPMYGIRGWLLVYLIVAGLNFLWLIASIQAFMSQGVIIPWAIFTVFTAVALFSLYAEKPWVRIYQIGFNLIYAALAFFQSPLVAAFMVVWAGYWFFSRRVKRTFCPPADEAQSA